MHRLQLDKDTKALVDLWIDSTHVIWNTLLHAYKNALRDDKLSNLEVLMAGYGALVQEQPRLVNIPPAIYLRLLERLAGLISEDGSVVPEPIHARKAFKVVGREFIKVVGNALTLPGTKVNINCDYKLYVPWNAIGYRVVRNAGKYHLYWVLEREDPFKQRNIKDMTTVAVTDNQLATDSQATRGMTAMPGRFQKIYIPEEDKEYWEVNGTKIIAYGLCGNAHAAEFIREYLAKGITHKTRVEHDDELDFEALIVDENHCVYTWSVYANKDKRGEQQFLLRQNPPTAIGSGFKFALAVLCNNKSAEKAVQTAIRLDPFSGGDIQVYNFPAKPEVPSVRPEHLKPKEEEKKEEAKADDKPAKGKSKDKTDKEPVKAA